MELYAIYIWIVIVIAVLYWTCSNFNYLTNVGIYTVAMGILPAIFSYDNFNSFIANVLITLLIGFILIKILIKITDYSDGGVGFFITGIVLQLVITKFVIAFLLSFVATII